MRLADSRAVFEVTDDAWMAKAVRTNAWIVSYCFLKNMYSFSPIWNAGCVICAMPPLFCMAFCSFVFCTCDLLFYFLKIDVLFQIDGVGQLYCGYVRNERLHFYMDKDFSPRVVRVCRCFYVIILEIIFNFHL